MAFERMTQPSRLTRALRALPVAAAALLAACGGGGDGGSDPYIPPGGGSCSVADQNQWLSRYFQQQYFWNSLAPRPDPLAYANSATVDDFFKASLYTGSDARFPADRWSYWQTTESFNRYWGDGNTLGFGLNVAGLEIKGAPTQPLLVRYVDPGSPAARAGLQRGDQILALNGRAAADLVAADDFKALSTDVTGTLLTVDYRRAGVDRQAVLQATTYALTPVPNWFVHTTGTGRRVGYVMVREMVTQVQPNLETAFRSLKQQGAQDLVLDLRYNGGGLVSTSAMLAAYAGGAGAAGQIYSTLVHNAGNAALNEAERFPSVGSSGYALSKVYVLAGRRTCSASEQLVNGLRGVGVDVVLIGEASCGKPMGFRPQSYCGNTYSIVNFESVNALNQGRYFDGFTPTCAVNENFAQPMGSVGDPLFATALGHAEGRGCVMSSPQRENPLQRAAARARPVFEASEMAGLRVLR